MDLVLLLLFAFFAIYGVFTRFFLGLRWLRRRRSGQQKEHALMFWLTHIVYGGLILVWLLFGLGASGNPLSLWISGVMPVAGLLWLVIDQGLELRKDRQVLDALEDKAHRVPALLADINRIARDHAVR